MSLTITISGIYLDPKGMVLPDKTLSFESLYNSSQTQHKTTVKVTTDEYGSYSVALVPNYYSVCEVDDKGRTKWLGNIQIFADSPPGTLNEYLTAFKTDQVQPGILAEMEEILEETKQAAENAGFVPRGPWSATVSYEKNDLVQYAGSQYLATADVSGIEPPAQPWQLFVSKGQDGPANELTIGSVETLPAGSAATAQIIGEAPEQKLNLGIPEGEKGDTGGGDIPLTWDAPGAVISAYFHDMKITSGIGAGSTVAGSSIYAGGIYVKSDGTAVAQWAGSTPAGTWRVMGYLTNPSAGPSVANVQRIDGTNVMPGIMLRAVSNEGSTEVVRNCRYSSPDNSTIDCEILNSSLWQPFTASLTDGTTYGPIIYQNAKEGRYGEIEPYSA